MRTLVACFVAGLALTVAACTTPEGGGTQSAAETVVTTDELRPLLTGKTVTFQGWGSARYLADGRYEYHGPRVDRGTYSFGDNRVCVTFDTGAQRCDRYDRRGDRYTLVNQTGQRFGVTIR